MHKVRSCLLAGFATFLLSVACTGSAEREAVPEQATAERKEFRERSINPDLIKAVVDLDGAAVNPLHAPGEVATVLCFVSATCPTSNRYAPKLNALHQEFSGRGIAFYLVYSDPQISNERIERHLASYAYAMPAVRDTEHELARMTRARITPQVAVITLGQQLAYMGRIDNWYIRLGKSRTRVTEHNLRDALEAVLEERPVMQATGRAVGCYIPDH